MDLRSMPGAHFNDDYEIHIMITFYAPILLSSRVSTNAIGNPSSCHPQADFSPTTPSHISFRTNACYGLSFISLLQSFWLAFFKKISSHFFMVMPFGLLMSAQTWFVSVPSWACVNAHEKALTVNLFDMQRCWTKITMPVTPVQCRWLSDRTTLVSQVRSARHWSPSSDYDGYSAFQPWKDGGWRLAITFPKINSG